MSEISRDYVTYLDCMARTEEFGDELVRAYDSFDICINAYQSLPREFLDDFLCVTSFKEFLMCSLEKYMVAKEDYFDWRDF